MKIPQHRSLYELVEKSLQRAAIWDELKDRLKNSVYAMDLFMITKYLERIGDHTVNVANWVIFSDSGIHNGVNLMGYINDKLDEK